jgi:chromosome segregation protein
VFLKSLTLKGFKSFAETSTLEFEPGVTVVVGPNGAGKSNIVDAVAWVLGAQGPRALRSSKMEDVIFAGTSKRPALGRAEVSLVIDNSAGLLPIEFSEVRITRVLWRTGESEYSINGAPCRLLDVQDLLSDTGVGRQQHTIISQAQLDAVLSARPEERRAIIEEAAGVSKHRRRKEKAARRLEATEAALVRAQDLLREVRRQLRPLERQAEAARRHAELEGELKALRRYLYSRDLAALESRLAACASKRAALAHAEALAVAALSRLDASVLAAEATLDEGRKAADLADLAELVPRAEGLCARAKGLVALLEERLKGVERERAAALDAGVVATLEAEAAALSQGLKDTDREAEELHALEAEALAAEEALKGEAAQVALAEAAVGAAEGARREAEAARQHWSARREALSQALDEALARAGGRRLAGLEGVVGALVELVEVEEGYEAAFEAAAGEALSAVLVEGQAAARAALAQLSTQGSAGAVIALEGLGRRFAVRGAAGVALPATAGWLRARVRARRGDVEELLDALLSGTAWVEGGWAEAVELSTAFPELTVVTLSGDRCAGPIWRTGAGGGGVTGAAIEEAEEALGRAASELEGALVREREAKGHLEAVKSRLAERSRAAARLRRELEVRGSALEERRALVAKRLGELERRLEGKLAERQQAAEHRAQLDRSARALEAMASLVRSRLSQLEAALLRLRERRQAENDSLRAAAESLEALRRERGNAERHLSSLREQLGRAEVEQAQLDARLEALTEAVRRELDCEPSSLQGAPAPELPPGTSASSRLSSLERELRLMGPVNPLALEEYAELSERHKFLEAQLHDVVAARRELAKVIKAVDAEIISVFKAAYDDVADNFAALVATLFPGGRGSLSLSEPADLLSSGVDIEVRPVGKNVKRMSLLSGGERSLVALAFLFAVFRSRPSPFYMLDEVEAALDDVNLHRFLELVNEFREEAQLLIVSHQKRTMEAADCLYGVSMAPGGSSIVVSEKLERPVRAVAATVGAELG